VENVVDLLICGLNVMTTKGMSWIRKSRVNELVNEMIDLTRAIVNNLTRAIVDDLTRAIVNDMVGEGSEQGFERI